MSQGNQKKFLTGYFAALGVGAVALGYLAFSSSGARDEAKDNYESLSRKLEGLQKSKVYPNSTGVENKTKQVKEMQETVDQLSDAVSGFQNEIKEGDEGIKGADLLSKLNRVGNELREYAKQGGATLGENYKLFERYASQGPRDAIAPKVNYWLDGMSNLTKIVIDSGARQIDRIAAPEAAFEKDTGAAPAPPAGAKQPKPSGSSSAAAKNAAPKTAPALIDEASVIERYPIQITFTGRDAAVRKAIEAIANTRTDSANGKYFYAVRQYRLENEKKAGPDKNVQVAEKEETDEAGNKYMVDAQIVLGGELVRAYAELELLRFLPATAPATAGK